MKMVEKTLLNKLNTHPNVKENLSVPLLVEKILERDEAILSETGAIRATTGKYTGRSPKDKYIVKDEVTESTVNWGPVNQPIEEKYFDQLYEKVVDYLNEKNEIFSFKGFAGADSKYRLPIQVINEYAWHNLKPSIRVYSSCSTTFRSKS